MVAAKIEMVNLRIEITPSSEHPAQLIVTLAETIIRGRPRARVSAATHVELRPCNYRLRTGGQPCNKRIAQAPTMECALPAITEGAVIGFHLQLLRQTGFN